AVASAGGWGRGWFSRLGGWFGPLRGPVGLSSDGSPFGSRGAASPLCLIGRLAVSRRHVALILVNHVFSLFANRAKTLVASAFPAGRAFWPFWLPWWKVFGWLVEGPVEGSGRWSRIVEVAVEG